MMNLVRVRFFSISSLLLFFANFLCAQTLDLSNVLDKAKVAELQKNRYISVASYDKSDNTLQLVPDTPLGKTLAGTWQKPKAPNYIAESLTLIKKSTSQNDTKKVNRILHNLSSLRGIDYYSNSKKRREILYSNAYMLDNPESKKTIPDLDETKNAGYLFLEDTGLGKCTYAITFTNTENEVSLRLLNLDTVKYVGVVGTKEEELLMSFLISDVGSDLLVYSVVRANIPLGTLLESTMSKKILARMDGVVKWFSENYSK